MQLPIVDSLPEAVASEALEPLFAQAISAEAAVTSKAQVLLELADKQWHCYERISPELSHRLGAWIKEVWDAHNVELTELIIGIIGHLGLDVGVPLMNEAQDDPQIDLWLKSEIATALREFGPLPLNPYDGMERNTA